VIDNLNSSSYETSATGDYAPEISVRRLIMFDRYEIEIELTKSGQFLGVSSVKVNKSFMDSIRSSNNSDVHDVEKYYHEE
jgi:hypothetical protein